MRKVILVFLSLLMLFLSGCSKLSPDQVTDYYRAEKNFSMSAKIECFLPDKYEVYNVSFSLNDQKGQVVFHSPEELFGYKIVYNNGFIYPTQQIALTPYAISVEAVILNSIHALRSLEVFSYSYSGNAILLRMAEDKTEYQIKINAQTYDIMQIKIFQNNELIYKVVTNV